LDSSRTEIGGFAFYSLLKTPDVYGSDGLFLIGFKQSDPEALAEDGVAITGRLT